MELKGKYTLLSDIVYNTIKDLIINESLIPGQKMSETQLANQLGVSRTPVREALRKLSVEGFVTLESNTSFIVTRFEKGDAMEIMACRRLLEGEAARLAALNIDEKGAETLRMEIERMDNGKYRIGEDGFSGDENKISESFSSYDMRFHDTIYRIADNSKLHNLSNMLQEAQVRRYLAKRWLSNVIVDDFIVQHKHIAEAIISGDSKLAERLAHEHIDHIIALVEDVK